MQSSTGIFVPAPWSDEIVNARPLAMQDLGRYQSAMRDALYSTYQVHHPHVQVKGYFEQQTGERIGSPTLVGKWDEAMSAVLADGSSRLLWKKADPAPDPTRCFSC